MTHNWIRRRREELGLSQEELSNKLQLEGQTFGRAAVSHWENGRYNPPLENTEFRHALAKVLKMDIRDMLIEAGFEISDLALLLVDQRLSVVTLNPYRHRRPHRPDTRRIHP